MEKPIDLNVYRSPSEKYVNFHKKKLILEYHKKLKAQYPNMKCNDLVNLISSNCGVDKHIVHNIISKYVRFTNVSSQKPKEKKPNAKNLDNLKKSAIRKKIHGMWLAGQVPIIHKIISAANIDSNLPRFDRHAMEKNLKMLNFDFVPASGKFALIEKDEIVSQRRHYLKNIRKYRNEGRPIYFLGDTLIEAGENDNNTQADEKYYSCPGTSSAPSEIRKKIIALHIGSADGFVHDCLLAVESNKNSYDYEDDISSDTFMNWFKKVLPLLKANAVIVMNYTSYNTAKIEYPNKTWSNDKIIEWLVSKGQIVNNDLVKVELIDLVKQVISANSPYLINEFANANNKAVLRIPNYHSELNAIEMAWNKVKFHVNTNRCVPVSKVIDLKKLTVEGVDLVTPQEWFDIVEYTVVKEEANCWNVDRIVNSYCDTHGATVEEKTKTSKDDIKFLISRFQ